MRSGGGGPARPTAAPLYDPGMKIDRRSFLATAGSAAAASPLQEVARPQPDRIFERGPAQLAHARQVETANRRAKTVEVELQPSGTETSDQKRAGGTPLEDRRRHGDEEAA